jgi:hypothetical protein
MVCLVQVLLDACLAFGVELVGDPGQHFFDVRVGVPDGKVPLAGELDHRLAVPGGSGQHDLAALLGGELVLAPGNGQTPRKPFDVPLEGSGVGLVEIVDVEDHLPLWGGVDPEVAHVRVSAQLNLQPRVRRSGQVGGHDQSGAPVERER